ncbi:hypothetical protein KY284_008198 [Solanum tuberosum]|nr:hypothetical protein KY284_008198 [Solanum tuberosum]
MESVWQKLKITRIKLKQLNTQEFNSVGAKIQECRQRLTITQSLMRDQQHASELFTIERDLKRDLEKWSGVEERIVKQKYKTKWLQLGDGNTAYFYANLKSRQAQNRIKHLSTAQGNIVLKTRRSFVSLLVRACYGVSHKEGASGWEANIDKSSIYFGGVKQAILAALGFTEGSLPFKTFLWTGGCEISKRSLIAWERLCLPRAAGGLNILDVYQWNHASIGKLLWNICRKKDALWVKWVHLYYIKDDAIWEA